MTVAAPPDQQALLDQIFAKSSLRIAPHGIHELDRPERVIGYEALNGVERRDLNEVFDFTFRFPQQPREVRIRMIYTTAPKPGVWIFVTPLTRS